jgi:hypothetical protein
MKREARNGAKNSASSFLKFSFTKFSKVDTPSSKPACKREGEKRERRRVARRTTNRIRKIAIPAIIAVSAQWGRWKYLLNRVKMRECSLSIGLNPRRDGKKA